MINRNILLLIVLVFVAVPAQSQKIDSLKTLLKGKMSHERIDILYDLSYSLIEVDNDQALQYALEGYNISTKRNDSLRIVRTGLVAASALRRLQKIDSSIHIYHPILSIAEKNNYITELSLILNAMGIAYSQEAKYDSALECYFRALEIRRSTGHTHSEIPVLINIGVIYYKLKNYQKALDIFLSSKKMTEEAGKTTNLSLLMINIGSCYAYLGNFEDALSYIERGVTAPENADEPGVMIYANFARGVVYFGMMDYGQAEGFFLESYRMAGECGDIRLQLDNIDFLSQICMVQNRLSCASLYLEHAESLIKQNSSYDLERTKIYDRFARLNRDTRDFKMASEYQLKYSELKDSIHDEETIMNLMKMEAEYLERENNARIAAQDAIIALKDEGIRQQVNLNKITGLIFIVSVGFIVLLFRNYQQKKKLTVLLDEKINHRTNELGNVMNQSLLTLKEREFIMLRALNGISETISTIQGLCSNGMREVSEPVARVYMEGIEASASRLVNYQRSITTDTLLGP